MALRALMLRKKLDDARKALDGLRAKDQEFEARQAELEASISEAETDEDRQAVEGLVEEFETEKDAHEKAKESLSGQVEQLERDLADEEAKQAPPAPPAKDIPPEERGGRKDEIIMNRKRKSFWGMDYQQRDAFMSNDSVKDFLQRVRVMGREKRAISGADLTIPDVMLELIRENISEYSKLISKVDLRQVPGTARQNIMGTVPEAVWTEACASLNELSLSFNQIEVDGYKVGGFIPVCNAVLEDSDLNLASEIMDAIGKAIGYALDKAVLYGTGQKMPVGVLTRLAQKTRPADWGVDAPEWKDLHESNVKSIAGKTGIELYKELILNAGAAKSTYSRGPITWVMNETTKAQLTAQSMSINAAGAIVAGMNDTMPVLGGEIKTLDFIPVGDVIFGYFDLYLLAQRAGAQLAQSEHVRFIEDQTVFKGTARYDGRPVFGEAFGVVNIEGKAPAMTAVFPPDTANTEETP